VNQNLVEKVDFRKTINMANLFPCVRTPREGKGLQMKKITILDTIIQGSPSPIIESK